MSFAQLAAATAAADTAYLEDVRAVQQSLQRLRIHVSAVHALQRVYRDQQCEWSRPMQPLEDWKVLQHQQRLQCELETARRSVDSVHGALQQLQRHVSAAASVAEKQERQLCYNQLLNTAGQLLRQLRDAVECKEWLLEHYRGILLGEVTQSAEKERALTLDSKQQGMHAKQPSSRLSQHSSDAVTATAQSAAARGDACQVYAATFTVGACGVDQVSNAQMREVASFNASKGTSSTQSHMLALQQSDLPPLQLQQRMQQPLETTKPVPIFIPDCKIDASLLQEKRDGLVKINQEIKSIQSLYEQMAFFTEQQGERLDAVDQCLAGARHRAASATRDMTITVRNERRRKWRRLSFLIWILLLLMLFGFALWWNATS
ncbi:hypothetical protein Efla_003284 [Eimeria flavescens]